MLIHFFLLVKIRFTRVITINKLSNNFYAILEIDLNNLLPQSYWVEIDISFIAM